MTLFRRTLPGLWLLAGLVAASGIEATTEVAGPPPPQDGELFVDAASASGLDFTHFNGASGEWYFPEINGSGVALFDYDNDGDLDVYLVQGAMLGTGKTVADALVQPKSPLADQLYRNDLEILSGGTRRLRFTNVTAASRIDATGYGMGAATGDFDNDGHVDLYVTNFGPNQLWRNRGDGTFEDVTEAWGVFEHRWSIAAAVLDYDRDGWLDLYLGNYLRFEFARQKTCITDTGARDYCHPMSFLPEPDLLFHNLGKGRFEEVAALALPERGEYSTLGVIVGDYNGDGWLDIYVANDEMPNQLWLNHQDGTFRNEALLGGCAVNGRGEPEASMGVDGGDIDNDGDEDLFMAHLVLQTNTLYVNDGEAMFRDLTTQRGLGSPSWSHTGFGTVFLDYDNDGWLDILVVNGAVGVIEELLARQDPFPFHETNQLFRNLGEGRFADISDRAGAVFKLSEVSRGAAAGDLDNDGDTDVVVTNNNGPVRLLLNRNEALPSGRHHWLGLRLLGRDVARDMLGAQVTVHRDGASPLSRRAGSDGSYASAQDPRVLFGLGENTTITAVEVLWPDGLRETWSNIPIDRYTTLRQGSGKTPERQAAPDTTYKANKP